MENISVSIRIRPLRGKESQTTSPWRIETNTISLCPQHGSVTSGNIFSFGKMKILSRIIVDCFFFYIFSSLTELLHISQFPLSLDNVYGPETDTYGLYNGHTKDIIRSAMNGFNGTVGKQGFRFPLNIFAIFSLFI